MLRIEINLWTLCECAPSTFLFSCHSFTHSLFLSSLFDIFRSFLPLLLIASAVFFHTLWYMARCVFPALPIRCAGNGWELVRSLFYYGCCRRRRRCCVVFALFFLCLFHFNHYMTQYILSAADQLLCFALLWFGSFPLACYLFWWYAYYLSYVHGWNVCKNYIKGSDRTIHTSNQQVCLQCRLFLSMHRPLFLARCISVVSSAQHFVFFIALAFICLKCYFILFYLDRSFFLVHIVCRTKI